MGRRRQGRDIDGVVLLDKPLGCSSNAALQQVRRALDARKAGHTGSLDPLATGLLPICLGEATKVSSYLLHADKEYRVTAILGRETATGDREGAVTCESNAPLPRPARLESLLAGFLGPQQQVPPMYSALKHNGQRLYDIARAGGTVARPPRSIVVYALTLIDARSDRLTLDVRVSSGTYIRSLIEDIARTWQGCAHVGELRRTALGVLGLERPMVSLDCIEQQAGAGTRAETWLWPVSSVLADWPQAVVTQAQAQAILHGRPVAAGSIGTIGSLVRIVAADGRFLGLGAVAAGGMLAPRRLFTRPQY